MFRDVVAVTGVDHVTTLAQIYAYTNAKKNRRPTTATAFTRESNNEG